MMISGEASDSICVILPVKDPDTAFFELVDVISVQLTEIDRLVVVDDNSIVPVSLPSKGSRVDVIRSESSIGPYGARNLGVEAIGHRYRLLVFCDLRCSPRADWLETLRSDWTPGTIVAGQVIIAAGQSVVARASATRDIFSHETYSKEPWFLPYFPTCNLLVEQRAFTQIGGFPAIRSGGDAAICWDLQLQLGHRMSYGSATVEWRPRTTLSEWREQWTRYGMGTAALWYRYRKEGATKPHPHGFRGWTKFLARAFARPVLRWRGGTGLMNSLGDLWFAEGYVRELSRLSRRS